MDRGPWTTWWGMVRGIEKSQTQLSPQGNPAEWKRSLNEADSFRGLLTWTQRVSMSVDPNGHSSCVSLGDNFKKKKKMGG